MNVRLIAALIVVFIAVQIGHSGFAEAKHHRPTPTPTPTPTSTPTPSPSPTPSGGPLPTGNIAPPAGQQWILVANDNFDQDSSVDQTQWNGGAGAPTSGFPMCHTPGIAPSACGGSYGSNSCVGGGTSCVQDCLGYAGGTVGSECTSIFTGIANGSPFFADIVPGIGLQVMSANTPSNVNYSDNTWTGLQNYGILSLAPGSYVEWMAKLPTDAAGEGDGLHTDLWCTTNSRTALSGSSELDVNEKVASTTSRNITANFIWDGGSEAGNRTYGVSGNANLDEAFHTYAEYWRAGTGAQGNWQLYVDGAPVGSAIAINSAQWASGVYCFGGWMQQSNITFPGSGPGIDSSTSKDNPLLVKYFRAWRAQ